MPVKYSMECYHGGAGNLPKIEVDARQVLQSLREHAAIGRNGMAPEHLRGLTQHVEGYSGVSLHLQTCHLWQSQMKARV